MRNLLFILFLLCHITIMAQDVTKQAVITIKTEMIVRAGSGRTIVDTFLVRNNYILEPIKKYYSTDEITLNLVNNKSSQRLISSSSKLKSYCFTNLEEMNGLAFDVEKAPSSKTIVPYQFGQDNPKQGTTFIHEPFLTRDLVPTDYVKEKDTIINGQECFLVKRTKVIQNVFRGVKSEKIIQLRLAINPKLAFYAFPFISERITEHFGGGAIVYMDGVTQSGFRSTMHYYYSEFTNADNKLFDHYQRLFESNITLLDKFKKKS